MVFLKNCIGSLLLWTIWFPLRLIIERLPVKTVYLIAGLLSPLFYIIAFKEKKAVMEELITLFNNKYDIVKIRRITKRSFDIYTKRQMENLFYGRLTKDKIQKLVSIKGKDHLDLALSKGKGVILINPHFGSFMLASAILGFMGYTVNQIAGEPRLEIQSKIRRRIFRVRERQAENLPVKMVRTDRDFIKTLVKALRNNEIVSIAGDGRLGKNWITVKTFDTSVCFSTGSINLAMSSKTPALPCFVVRRRGNINELIIESPLKLEYSANKKDSLEKNVNRYTKIFEKYLVRYPCHYGMILQKMADNYKKGIIDYPFFENQIVDK